MIEWRDLETDPPTGDEYAVMLFPCKTDVGLLYIVSNPYYAKANGLENGYTHWAEFNLAPTHQQWVKWQDALNQQASW